VARMDSERSAFLGSLDDLLRSLAHKPRAGSNSATTPSAGAISIFIVPPFLFFSSFSFSVEKMQSSKAKCLVDLQPSWCRARWTTRASPRRACSRARFTA
jgi:hypothetical protein